jgi:hypothetical protein
MLQKNLYSVISEVKADKNTVLYWLQCLKKESTPHVASILIEREFNTFKNDFEKLFRGANYMITTETLYKIWLQKIGAEYKEEEKNLLNFEYK